MSIKLQTWLFMRNNGDGSVSAVVFPSEELAEWYAEDWTHKMGVDRYLNDIYYDVFEIDNNRVVPPDYIYEISE